MNWTNAVNVTSNATHSPVHSLVNERDLSLCHKLHIWIPFLWLRCSDAHLYSEQSKQSCFEHEVENKCMLLCNSVCIPYFFLNKSCCHFINQTRKSKWKNTSLALSGLMSSLHVNNFHKCIRLAITKEKWSQWTTVSFFTALLQEVWLLLPILHIFKKIYELRWKYAKTCHFNYPKAHLYTFPALPWHFIHFHPCSSHNTWTHP